MAVFKLTLNKNAKKIFSKTEKGMIAQVRKEFKKKSPKLINVAIQKSVLRGVSPVKGKRFIKYSKSYLQQIRKKLGFFTTKSGKIVAVSSDAFSGLTQKDVSAASGSRARSKQLIGQLKGSRAKSKAFVDKLNSDLIKFNKKVSPRNMKVSGDMLRALKTVAKGGILSSFRLVITWTHFLADIHNSKGAGKSKVIRRLLPDKSGEKFNKRISDRLLSELKKAADKVAKRFS